MEDLRRLVSEWISNGCNIQDGVAIYLRHISPNTYYMMNVQRKSFEEAKATLLTEFAVKLKCGVKELNPPQPSHKEEGDASADGCGSLSDQNIVEEKQIEEKRVVLRQEFPFLNDVNCPDILKILVADMIRDYYRYTTNHPLLFEVDPCDTAACYQTVINVVEPYLNNRKIWEELNYYKLHGKLLGKHEKMKELNEIDIMRAKSTVELIKDMNSRFPKNRSHARKMLSANKGKHHPQEGEWRQKVAYYTRMIEVAKVILEKRD